MNELAIDKDVLKHTKSYYSTTPAQTHEYKNRLEKMLSDLREEFRDKNLPIMEAGKAFKWVGNIEYRD